MSKTVFILGAGASKEAGAPLMNDFLDKAGRIYDYVNCPEDYKADYKRVFEAISNLQRVHSKSILNIYNIEEVFSAFEMASLLNKFPGFPTAKSEDYFTQLLKSMKRVIYITLIYSMPLEASTNSSGLPAANDSYMHLYKIIESIKKIENEMPSVITFNYDLALDYALSMYNVEIDYCLSTESNIDEKNDNKINVLKLHGSLNWFSSSKDEKKILPFNLKNSELINEIKINTGKYNHGYEECNKYYLDLFKILERSPQKYKVFLNDSADFNAGPFIIPPTWDKSKYHQGLSIVWSKAAYCLANAKNVFIIGYSLPETDNFFRYLFALGSEGEKTIQRFWVFNPDKENVENKFLNFIGTGIKERFEFIPIPFKGAIELFSSLYRNYDDLNLDVKGLIRNVKAGYEQY